MKYSELMDKYRDVIPYAIFGVLTTLVNIISYWLFSHVFHAGVMASTVIAGILSVLFAYVTNRKWVFHSEAAGTKAVMKEMASFFGCRLATGVLDWLCMFLFVDVMQMNDMVIKVLANIAVIVLNYIASKLVIFRHDRKNQNL